MVVRLKSVDAVIVGMGWTGSILARELTKAGLNVVGLERGPKRVPADDFVLPGNRDELKYAVRLELIQDASKETISMRHAPVGDGAAGAPARRLSPGEWARRRRRCLERHHLALPAEPTSCRARSTPSAMARKAIPADMTDCRFRRHL